MMTSDTSERGMVLSPQNSSDHDDAVPPVTLDMGNTVTVMSPTHDEMESREASRKHPRWLVYTVIGLSVLAVAGIFTLVTVSAHGKKNTNQASQADAGLTIIDDSPQNSGTNNGGAADVSPPMVTSPPAPTPSPTPHPVHVTMPPSEKLGCLTDRFDNENYPENNRLFPGQYICSRDDERRFQFGVSPGGDLLWKDTEPNKTTTQVLFQNPYTPKGGVERPLPDDHPFDYFFSLRTDGTFVMNVVNNTNPDVVVRSQLWTKKPKYKITLSEKCLPHHDCPYLHVHQGGTCVLNWIGMTIGNPLQVGSNDNWQNHNFMKVYNFSNN
ncbi:expressed unknown protein [Seminavis robusta]|uniref:Uncharacterized protein n=1 Tax=Seminavis robusta TaxID=568900 RepID=A0A9N8HCN1_9STRA|nr:expressed unknown protein [Seminavis robusta]|eukprot:Sro309_g113760.1 n/a (325) ;mRNA; r:26240-27214